MTDRYSLEQVQWPTTPFGLREHCILLGKRGSEAHGTYVPPTNPDSLDDRDIMGLCVPPLDYYFGLKQWEGVDGINGVWDVVLYELQKFTGLLVKQNPNVLCMLWLEPEDYLLTTPEGETLVNCRNAFRAAKPAYESIVGYAQGQLRRMTHIATTGEGTTRLGAKRKALVEKFGYDTKNAAHLVRLLHMGIEYLRDGTLKVRRTADRDLILDIKSGKWELAEVQIYAQSLFAQAHEAFKSTSLPEAVDFNLVNDITLDLVSSCQRRYASSITGDP